MKEFSKEEVVELLTGLHNEHNLAVFDIDLNEFLKRHNLIEEMTLSEVCKELKRNIKIVK